MKLRLASICLAVMLALTACAPNAGESKGDALLRQAKTTGQVLSAALDQGITLEAQLATSGDIDPTLEPSLRQWLKDGKKATDEFNTRAAKYTHFDSASKADIIGFAGEAVDFVDRMNNEGVLRIKNPNSQAVAAGIIAGAKVAAVLLKTMAAEADPLPAPAPAA